MPTETFMKLSQEKKDKIMQAAKKEFSRVPLEETSIKNIVEEAGIARGSFYQYFQSKEDLLKYIFCERMENLEKVLEKNLEKTKGNIFEFFITMYDYMVDQVLSEQDSNFHRKIFENIRTSEDTIFLLKPPKEKMPFPNEEMMQKIEKKNLKMETKEDLRIIIEMLHAITKKALVSTFKYDSKEQAKEEYQKQIEYLKYGIYQN